MFGLKKDFRCLTKKWYKQKIDKYLKQTFTYICIHKLYHLPTLFSTFPTAMKKGQAFEKSWLTNVKTKLQNLMVSSFNTKHSLFTTNVEKKQMKTDNHKRCEIFHFCTTIKITLEKILVHYFDLFIYIFFYLKLFILHTSPTLLACTSTSVFSVRILNIL